MTVSRVVNKDGNVRQATRERVNAAITALKYAPNSAARLLAGAAQTRILLLYGNPSRAYLSEVLLGCLAEASRSDVQILLERCDSRAAAATIARYAVERGVDGVILPPPYCDSAEATAVLLKAEIPTVVLATGAPAKGAFAVMIDDVAAARDMTRHLLELGHRRIGFIVGNRNQTASKQRLEGYRLALREMGIPLDRKLIAEGDFSYRSGLRAATKLLSISPRPTALFASNDDMAAAAVAAAHRKHLDVPEHLSVCGFDDTGLATTISPELTTVRQPIAEMARAAVEMLTMAARRRRARHPMPIEQRVFHHQIIRRASDSALQRQRRP